jgi:ketosteroid isomerase-like protein
VEDFSARASRVCNGAVLSAHGPGVERIGYALENLAARRPGVLKHPSILFFLLAGIAGCRTVPEPMPDRSADVAAIRQVVESFRTSIIKKDKATYMALFFSDQPGDIVWQFVSEDTRLEQLRKTKPDAIKARRIPSNNFISLIDGVTATKEPMEETFANISIDTDGEIAAVSFDYTFLANTRKTNWGREMWQLVRTENGWKIISVIYTIRDEWSAAGTAEP